MDVSQPSQRRWLSAVPLLEKFDITTLSPSARQLRAEIDAQLLRTVVLASLLINIPIGGAVIFLLRRAMEAGRIPPISFYSQLINFLAVLGFGWLLLSRQRPREALLVGMAIQIAATFVYIWFSRESEAFISIMMILMLPSIVFSMPRIISLLGLLSLVFLGLVWIEPQLQRSDSTIPVVIGMVFIVVATFASVGVGIRRAFNGLSETLALREAESAARVRLEERAHVLDEHYQRLMSAQHDLRAPCNTALRMVQLLQDPTLDPATGQLFVRRIEPVLFRLRTRIDALMDDAKAPILGERRDLPPIDLAALVSRYLPELQHWAAIKHAETGVGAVPTITIAASHAGMIRAREGELQRILENLVLNSVAAGATTIAIRLEVGSDEQIELVIEDDGEGFPEEVLDRAIRATYSQQKGAGLGLVGVTANVAAFQGTLHLENWTDGARVRLRFPHAR